MSSTSLKSLVENHVVVIFLSALVLGFGAGFGAHIALISNSGQVVVASDTLERVRRGVDGFARMSDTHLGGARRAT